MPYGLIQTAAPAEEPVTLAEAKLWCRVDTDLTVDDALITALIPAARIYVETFTGRQLVTATYRLTLDRWPVDEDGELPSDAGSGGGGVGVIRPPRPPLQGVTLLRYVDSTTELETTLAAADYQVDTATEPGRIIPAIDESWPFIADQLAAVKVIYTAGYGNAAAVPDGIKVAMRMLITSWYQNRSATGTDKLASVPHGVEMLLWSFRTGSLSE